MRGKTIEHYRADYKELRAVAGRFGVTPADFDARVRTRIGPGAPEPYIWTFHARDVADSITHGRCCPKAEGCPCVCEVSYKCPDHGKRCFGSHD